MRNNSHSGAGVTRVAVLSSAGGGGAGIAARRLAQALDADPAFEADFLTREELGELLPKEVALGGSMTNHQLSDTHFTVEYPGYKRPWVVDLLSGYDVVNIHWTSCLISLAEIDVLARRGTRILYMLHDFHHITGGCHYPAGCTRMRQGCMNCPQVDDSLCDASFIPVNLRLKQGIFARPNVHLAAPSKYLRDQAVTSGIVLPERAHVLRNVYLPVPDVSATGRGAVTRIFLIADSLTERRKGMGLAVDSLRKLSEWVRASPGTRATCIDVIGKVDGLLSAMLQDIGLPCVQHGHVTEHAALASILAQGDILLTCSFEDNWPNVLVEAGSYGLIPVVGPGHGCEEFVQSYRTGHVSPEYTADAFANTLIAALQNFPARATQEEYAAQIRRDHAPRAAVNRFAEIASMLVGTDHNRTARVLPLPTFRNREKRHCVTP